jgi:hypothetical protein
MPNLNAIGEFHGAQKKNVPPLHPGSWRSLIPLAATFDAHVRLILHPASAISSLM